MAHRFFTTADLSTNDIVVADEAQVHQITRVLRLGAGDTCVLCAGDGEDVEVELVSVATALNLRVLSRRRAWVPSRAVHISLASIRKERFEWALEKCTELGVSSVAPVIAERSERGIVPRARAERILREAAEQCGRGDLPTYGDVTSLGECIAHALGQGHAVIACTHEGTSFPGILDSALFTNHRSPVTILIGPEGGWSPLERALFKKHDILELSLGLTNLRAETAAVVAATCLHLW